MQSSRHDFDTGDFVPSIGHAMKFSCYDHYLSNMPANIVREFIDSRVDELTTILQKVNVESALEEKGANEKSVDIIKSLSGLNQNTNKRRKR